jgi:hypothetical protein
MQEERAMTIYEKRLVLKEFTKLLENDGLIENRRRVKLSANSRDPNCKELEFTVRINTEIHIQSLIAVEEVCGYCVHRISRAKNGETIVTFGSISSKMKEREDLKDHNYVAFDNYYIPRQSSHRKS